ncbi:MAG: DUF4199 domain-containing protein [Saprospiraceae bacterium]|nr:DUF4199 domain-containing protein [Saprospiraceae bacterium]
MNPVVLKYGIMAGVSTVVYLLLFYFIQKPLFLDAKVLWSTLIIYLFFMFKAVNEIDDIATSIDFKSYIQIAFWVFVIADLIYYPFFHILCNYLDTSLLELMRSTQSEYLELTLKQSTRIEEQQVIRKTIEELKIQDMHITFSNTLYSLVQGIIGGFLLSVIVAMITAKRNEG